MANLSYFFPGGIYPADYTPPIPEFVDYFPGWQAFADLNNHTVSSSSSTQQVLSLENGLKLVLIGSGLTYDGNHVGTGGTITSIELRLNDGTSLLQSITDISEAFTAIYSYIGSSDQFGLYDHLFQGNDVLNGGAPDADLSGGDGDDVFNASALGSYMWGGDGIDTYNGTTNPDSTDQAVFDDSYKDMAATGAVTINAVAGTVIDSYGNTDIIHDIDFFRASRFADTITGSSANETFAGLGGRDIINGGGGTDTARYDIDSNYSWAGYYATGAVFVDLDAGIAIDPTGQRDTLISIENIRGSYNDDLIFGNDAANYFRGFDGDDYLYGEDGNDRLEGGNGADMIDGGEGADTMRGGAGNDTYFRDHAGDIVDEIASGSGGTDAVRSDLTINLSDTVHFKGDIEVAMLIGVANVNLFGNALNNALTGNFGNNVLNGMAGADAMRGMEGNDTYVRNHVNDVVDESLADSGGFDTVQSALTINLSDAVRFKGAVEGAMLTGAANVNAYGNALANILTGNAGANILNGLAGNDSLRGMDGNDRLYGNIGNDTLAGGTGNDVFVFNTALNNTANVDTITDFSAPNDNIWLENAVFTALTTTGTLSASNIAVGAASTPDQHILYNTANGWLSYDADGNGASAAIHFATLTAHPAITSADFVVV